jgi:hypothetical protein
VTATNAVLIDSSAWIEYFRATGSPAALKVRRLLSEEHGQVLRGAQVC